MVKVWQRGLLPNSVYLEIRFIDFLRFTLLQIGGLSGLRHFGLG